MRCDAAKEFFVVETGAHIHPTESKKRIGIELSDKLTLTKAQQTE